MQKHAPWSKKVLIPLWVFQVGFSLVQFALSLTIILLKTLQRASEPHTVLTAHDKQKLATFAINGFLELCLSIYIIVLIVKFAKCKLESKELLVQSVVAVSVCVVGLVLYVVQKPYPEGFEAILISVELLVSAGIGGNAWVIRKRIVRGEVEEMEGPREKKGEVREVGSGVVSRS